MDRHVARLGSGGREGKHADCGHRDTRQGMKGTYVSKIGLLRLGAMLSEVLVLVPDLDLHEIELYSTEAGYGG